MQQLTQPARRRPSTSTVVRSALILACLYLVVLGFFSVLAHLGLQTQMNDLGNADQAVWAASRGDWTMQVSNDLDGRIRSRIGIHANFIFWPLSLLYRVWADPAVLLVIGTLACAIAGLGLFALALRLLGPTWWALIPQAAFYLSPLTHDANLYDFHAITIATACLVWAVWAFSGDRELLGHVLLLGALSCKEDVALVGIALGATMFCIGRRRRAAAIVVLSVVYLVVTVGLVVPLFNEGDLLSKTQTSANRYQWLIDHPDWIIPTILRPDRLRLPLYFLLSGAIAAWSARWWLLPLIPPLAAGWLSVTIWMTRLTGTYYWVIVEAIIIIACIHAARPRDPGGLDRRPLVYLGSATVLFSLLFSPLPYGSGASTANFEVRDDRAVLSELAAAIPDDAAVSVQNNLGPHLSQRHQIATYPRRLEHSEWVLLQLRYLAGPSSGLFVRSTPRFPLGMRPVDLAGAVDELLRSPEWRLVEQRGGFYLFRRDPNGEDSAAPGFLDDVRLLGSQIDAASAHRSPLTRVAVEPLGWGDFVGAPNRNRGSR